MPPTRPDADPTVTPEPLTPAPQLTPELPLSPAPAADEVAFSTRTPGPAACGSPRSREPRSPWRSVWSRRRSPHRRPRRPPAPRTARRAAYSRRRSSRSTRPRGGARSRPWTTRRQGLPRHHDQGDQRLERDARDRRRLDPHDRGDGPVELTKGGQAIELSDLAVGDQVRFNQTRNDDGTYTVEAIAVVVPSVRGWSARSPRAASRSRPAMAPSGPSPSTARPRTSTGRARARSPTSRTAGRARAGQQDRRNALTALTVRVAADRAVGTVTAKTADTITIKKRDGSSLTIHVDADTTYRVAGEDSDRYARGRHGRHGHRRLGRARDGRLDRADAVVAGTAGHLRRSRPQGGGFGGFGPGPPRSSGLKPPGSASWPRGGRTQRKKAARAILAPLQSARADGVPRQIRT